MNIPRNHRTYVSPEEMEDDLDIFRTARGMAHGALIGLAIWAALIVGVAACVWGLW